ncbi:MAG: hypothetical protein HKO57_12525 [Akkermansiaceae bacterium]|nr:hypothetical protein [Akkermansiaceae bacterium]
MQGYLPPSPGEKPPEAELRLEDELGGGEIDDFCAWIIGLSGPDGKQTPPAEILRAGIRGRLASLRTLRKQLQEAEEAYEALLAELAPLLPVTCVPAHRKALPADTLEIALACLQTGERIRNLRIRLAHLTAAVPGRVAAVARTRGFSKAAQRRISQQARRALGLA